MASRRKPAASSPRRPFDFAQGGVPSRAEGRRTPAPQRRPRAAASLTRSSKTPAARTPRVKRTVQALARTVRRVLQPKPVAATRAQAAAPSKAKPVTTPRPRRSQVRAAPRRPSTAGKRRPFDPAPRPAENSRRGGQGGAPAAKPAAAPASFLASLAARAARPEATASAAAEAPRGRSAGEDAFVIPLGYGDTRIVLLVKDPWWLYAYWEVHPSDARRAKSRLTPEEVIGLQSVLRVYDVTGGAEPETAAHWMDVPLSGLATNWYLNTNAPDHAFVVEIGLLTRGGRFLAVARSNQVRAPRSSPSDVIDEEWRIADEPFWKLLDLAGCVGMGSSPGAAKSALERVHGSAGAAASPAADAQAAQPRKLRVHADLIVHGTADPNATVTIQGQPVALRSDGSFSVRFALPEGTQAIDVAATTATHQAAVTPVVMYRVQERSVPAPRGAASPASPPEARADA